MMKPWASYILYNTLFLIFSFTCPDTMITHTRIFALAYGATFSNIVVGGVGRIHPTLNLLF